MPFHQVVSEKRPMIRLILLAVLVFIGFYLSVLNNSLALLYAAIGIAVVILIQFLTFSRTTLTLDDEKLSMKRSSFGGVLKDGFEIELTQIRTFALRKRVHDNWELLQRPIWEFLFPSGEHSITIHLIDAAPKTFQFKGNLEILENFLSKLPQRIPN